MRKNATLKKKKKITTPLTFLSFTNFKEAQYPWYEFEYALHPTEQSGELFATFIQGEALDHSNCSSYSILFWNNLIFELSRWYMGICKLRQWRHLGFFIIKLVHIWTFF